MRAATAQRQQGFTLVEVLVVMIIIVLVFALASINLGRPQTQTSLNTTVSSLMADIKSQQMLAMAGDQGGTAAQQPQGLYLQPGSYTLFAGASYSAGDGNNFVVTLNQGITLTTTLPGSTVLFDKGTGNVVGYTAGSNTITVSAAADTTTITLSQYGALTLDTTSTSSNWYNASYLYRIPVTLNHSQVSGGADLTDFPVLISTTQADLKTIANGGHVQNSNGYDMVFTAGDGTTALSYETESYNATTGQLIAWVKVPTLSASVDTTLYLYYDNSAISTFQGNVNGTWSANYGAVYHLNETATGAAGEYKDSTANANNGQGGAGSTAKLPTNVAGKIGSAQNFSGTQTIYMSSMTGVPALNSAAQTLSWWYNVGTNPGATESIISLINSGNTAANQAEFRGGALGMGQWGGAMTVTSAPLAANSWHYVTWVNSGGTNYLYFDGAQVATSATALQTGTVGQLILSGYDTTPNEGYIGQLDEVRIAGTARTAGWVATTYNNQNSPSTFETFGAPEVAWHSDGADGNVAYASGPIASTTASSDILGLHVERLAGVARATSQRRVGY